MSDEAVSEENPERSQKGLVVSERWQVHGMDCAHCASRVEKTLIKIQGVRRASVSFATGAVLLEYDVTRVLPRVLEDTIASLGYVIKTRPGGPLPTNDQNQRVLANRGQKRAHSHGHEHARSQHHLDLPTGTSMNGQNERDRTNRGQKRAHSHGDEHAHSHGEGGLCELVPPLAGAIGIALGFLTKRLGYDWHWIVYVVAAVVAGYPVLKAGLRSLVQGMGADISLLTTVAGTGALLLGESAEGAAVLTLFSVGEYLEGRASDRARRSIRDVLELAPLTARVKRKDDLAVFVVPVEDVIPGDTVVILPGERIPADGWVTFGDSSVNEAPITGESVPVDKTLGSQVFAGTMNGEGSLEVLVTREASDSAFMRIVTMVEDAQSKKAESERIVDRFARYWTPSMILLSFFVAFGIPLLTDADTRIWIYRGLTVLLVSCPCSLVISTPVTVVAAIARAARNGVLIKGGVHLEELGRVRAIAFDKTGTVTTGNMSVETVVPAGPEVTEDEVLWLAASVESRSEHPLAKAILNCAETRGVAFQVGERFVSLRGRGAKAKVAGRNAYVGSEALFDELGVPLSEDLRERIQALRRCGQTTVLTGNSERVLGVIGISDKVRDEAREALALLKEMGLHVTMLTGDHHVTALAVAKKTGMESFRADLLPDGKQEAIREIQNAYGRTAMVGDGVNDAPSLAQASLGIAMGHGADVALETADVALMNDNLRKIPWAIGLGKASARLILQNVVFSIVPKLAALGLVLGGVLPLWLAVLADSGTAIIVTLNGLRILAYEQEQV